jgi:hypothetical protein
MLHLAENTKVIGLLKPAADAAGRTGRWITIKDAQRAWIVVYLDQGNAATVLLTPRQASAVAGTGSKVLANAVQIWANLDTATSDVLVRQTDAVNFTTDAGVKEKIVLFQIELASLDIAGGFDCITVATGASNVANTTSAFAELETRYSQATLPRVDVD